MGAWVRVEERKGERKVGREEGKKEGRMGQGEIKLGRGCPFHCKSVGPVLGAGGHVC